MGDQDLRFRLDSDFNNFLIHITKRMGKMYNYISEDCPDYQFVIKATTTDFTFKYLINPDKTSYVEIAVLSRYGRSYDPSFLTHKFKKPMLGYVYFLASEYGYKIGCSSKLDQRINVFAVKLPFKTHLHSFIECKKHSFIESELHKLLSHKRINGEWFSLDDSDFLDIDRWALNQGLNRTTNG